MSTAQKAARGAAWTIASSLASRGISLVGTLVLIRFVSPSAYGEAAAAVVVVGTVNQFSTLGVGVYAIAKKEATREDLYHGTLIHIVLGLLAFFGLLALGKPLSPAFGAPSMYKFVPFLAAAALADRIAYMPERVLIRTLRFKRVSLIRSLGEITYALVSVAAAWRGLGAAAIVVGNVARALVKMVITLRSADRLDWLDIGPVRMSVLRRIGGYGILSSLGALGYYATVRWDNLMVSRYFGAAVMGAYNLAYSLAEIPATQVAEQISDVMQASYAQMKPDERRATLLRAFGIIALITFPLAVGLGSVAPTLADLFLDKKWAGTGSMLMVLAMVFVVRPPYAVAVSLFVVERGPKRLILVEWLTVAALLLGLVTVGHISPIWACGAVGVAFMVRMLLALSLVSSASAIRMTSLLGRLVGPLVACVPMAAAVFGVRIALSHAGIGSNAVQLGAEMIAGGLTYVGAALLFAPAPVGEVLRFARRKSRNSPPAEPAPSGTGTPPPGAS